MQKFLMNSYLLPLSLVTLCLLLQQSVFSKYGLRQKHGTLLSSHTLDLLNYPLWKTQRWNFVNQLETTIETSANQHIAAATSSLSLILTRETHSKYWYRKIASIASIDTGKNKKLQRKRYFWKWNNRNQENVFTCGLHTSLVAIKTHYFPILFARLIGIKRVILSQALGVNLLLSQKL